MRLKGLLAISCVAIAAIAVSLAGTASAETEKFWEMGGVKQTKKIEIEGTGKIKFAGGGASTIECESKDIITANELNIASSTGLMHFSLDEEFTKKCVGAGDTYKDCQVKEVEDTNGASYTWQYHLTETKDKTKEMVITNAVIKIVLESIAGKTCPDTTVKFDFPKMIAIPDVSSGMSTLTFSGEGKTTVDGKEAGAAQVSGSGEIKGSNKGTYGFL